MRAYKIWDMKHQRYCVNQGRVSSNKHHPGRVFFDPDGVEKTLRMCDEWYGDLDDKKVHTYDLTSPVVVSGEYFLKHGRSKLI